MGRHFCICLFLKLFLVICQAKSNNKVYENNDLDWLQNGKIAVLTGIKDEVAITAPNGPPNKTEIDIEMLDVEIIEFDFLLQQFSIRMDLIINWSEKRLLLKNSSLVNGWIQTKAELVWSPKIVMHSDSAISESRTEELMEVEMDSQSLISKWNWYNKYTNYLVQSFSAKMKFSLNTTVNCSRDFNNHICKIEVSSLEK